MGDLVIPVRIVCGTDAGWIAPAVAERIRSLIPGATLRFVARAGHLVQYDAPLARANEVRRGSLQTQARGPAVVTASPRDRGKQGLVS